MYSTLNFGLISKIHYNHSVVELKKYFLVKISQDECNRKYFELSKIDKTYVNNEELTLLFDQLAEKCYDSIFPLTLKKEHDLALIQVINRHDILNRWNSTKPEIEGYFKGDLTQKYCTKFEKTLRDEVLLNQFLQNDLFIFYLTQIKSILGNSYSAHYEHIIPVQPTLELPFVTEETYIADDVNEDGLTYFEIKSEMDNNYSNALIYKLLKFKLLTDDPNEFSWNYTLNGYVSSNKTLHNLTMIITLGNEKQTKIEIDIAKIA